MGLEKGGASPRDIQEVKSTRLGDGLSHHRGGQDFRNHYKLLMASEFGACISLPSSGQQVFLSSLPSRESGR